MNIHNLKEITKTAGKYTAAIILGGVITFSAVKHLSKDDTDKINDLNHRIERLNVSHNVLEKELDSYKATEQWLIDSGATAKQAKFTIKAAEVHNVSPKMLGALIYSESSWKAHKHALSFVTGICGINTKVWNDICPYNPFSDKGNINASAWILELYLKESHGNYKLAISKYKGYSKLGRSQANHVMKIFYSMK